MPATKINGADLFLNRLGIPRPIIVEFEHAFYEVLRPMNYRQISKLVHADGTITSQVRYFYKCKIIRLKVKDNPLDLQEGSIVPLCGSEIAAALKIPFAERMAKRI